MNTTNIHAMRELWHHENKLDTMQHHMKNWDKKLSNLDDEMLYYVFMRAGSIIEYRQENGDE